MKGWKWENEKEVGGLQIKKFLETEAFEGLVALPIFIFFKLITLNLKKFRDHISKSSLLQKNINFY